MPTARDSGARPRRQLTRGSRWPASARHALAPLTNLLTAGATAATRNEPQYVEASRRTGGSDTTHRNSDDGYEHGVAWSPQRECQWWIVWMRRRPLTLHIASGTLQGRSIRRLGSDNRQDNPTSIPAPTWTQGGFATSVAALREYGAPSLRQAPHPRPRRCTCRCTCQSYYDLLNEKRCGSPKPTTPAPPPVDAGAFDGQASEGDVLSVPTPAAATRQDAGAAAATSLAVHLAAPIGHSLDLASGYGERDSQPSDGASEFDAVDPVERARILEKIFGHAGGGPAGRTRRRAQLPRAGPARCGAWCGISSSALPSSTRPSRSPSTAFLWAPPLPMRVDVLVDALLLCDVVLCFFTGFVDADDNKTMDLYRVARHYFLGWFFFDLASALPFDAIAKAFLSPEDRMAAFQNQAFRIVNVLKLIRPVAAEARALPLSVER